jgi:hypothetical protein
VIRKITLAIALIGTAVSLSACVVAPAPYYARPGCYRVPGHYNAYGAYVPPHCR